MNPWVCLQGLGFRFERAYILVLWKDGLLGPNSLMALCVYIHIYIYVHMYTDIYVYVYIYIYIFINMRPKKLAFSGRRSIPLPPVPTHPCVLKEEKW